MTGGYRPWSKFNAHSWSLLNARRHSLHDWLQETLRSLSQKSALEEAIRYALKLWVALVRYTGDGRIEIDNNAAERSL